MTKHKQELYWVSQSNSKEDKWKGFQYLMIMVIVDGYYNEDDNKGEGGNCDGALQWLSHLKVWKAMELASGP